MKTHKNEPLKEELTTAMHAELMEREMSREELNIWSVLGAIRRGVSKEDACKQHGLTVKEWEDKYEEMRWKG